MTGLILAIILTLLSFVFKKSKILTILLFLLMWILFGWNYYNGDYSTYEGMYNDLFELTDIFKYEGGYNILMLFSNLYGIDFQGFLIIISAIILLLLLRFVLIFSKFPAIVTAIFLFVFFPLQYVLLRNFLAFAIVLQGFVPLLNNSKFKYSKFIFFVLLASTIHISSLFYLLFFPSFFKKKIGIHLMSVVVFFALLVFIFGQSFITAIIDLSPKDRSSAYNTSVFLFLIYSFYQIMNLYFVKHFLNSKNNSNDASLLEMNKNVLNVNVLMLFLIVVYFKFAIFIRILLNFSLVNVIFVTHQIMTKKNNVNMDIVLMLFYLLFIFFTFIYVVKDDSLVPMFYSNLLLK